MFYGPIPIGEQSQITTASPVNVIGRIVSTDKSVLAEADGARATFKKA